MKSSFLQLFSGLIVSGFLLAGSVALSADTEKPHVVIVSMGGTIASIGETRMGLNTYGGRAELRVGPEVWVAEVPEVHDVARISIEDMRPPEGTMPPMSERWMKVAQRLQELANDSSVDGIVVSHGTNTMAETAFFMNLVVHSEKPIVYVGSQRPWNAISSDGPLNFYNAVRVAASPKSHGMGVLHVMNDTIQAARDVTKMIAYRVEAFESTDVGPLGFADADAVVYYRKPLRRHTTESEFHISELPGNLPKVEILYAYSESPAGLVDALVFNGVDGIIIDGTGAGATAGYTERLRRAMDQGIVVVATARTRGGRVQATPRRLETGIIPGDNLPPEKARILLQLALTQTKDFEELRRIFDSY